MKSMELHMEIGWIYIDKEVLKMGEIIKINRGIELYVQHGIDVPEIIPSNEINDELVGVDKDPVFEGPVKDPPNQANVKHTTKNPKASNKPTTSPTPITEPQHTIPPQHDDCFDDRPDSPIPFSELDDLEGYVEEQFGEDHELDDENEIGDENEVGDDGQLQQEAEKGKIQSKGVGSNRKESAPSTQNTEGEGPLSEYEDSDEEIDTPNESEEDESGIRRKSSRGLLVIEDTDWHSFVWKVGYRLTSRESFRKAIAHFAIAQGRNISFVSSSKKRQQRMEAMCVPGCPFRALLRAVATVLPNAEHRHCARHIFSHWHKAFKGEDYKLKFWTATKSYNEADFNEAMQAVATDNPASATSFREVEESRVEVVGLLVEEMEDPEVEGAEVEGVEVEEPEAGGDHLWYHRDLEFYMEMMDLLLQIHQVKSEDQHICHKNLHQFQLVQQEAKHRIVVTDVILP
ncbi:Cobyric acid synthase [Bienertia sinuspersici]